MIFCIVRSTVVNMERHCAQLRARAEERPRLTAYVDRLVHHATIFEMNVESYRRRTAIERKQHGAGRPANYATPKNVGKLSRHDNQPDA
jgi:hypothetical protein